MDSATLGFFIAGMRHSSAATTESDFPNQMRVLLALALSELGVDGTLQTKSRHAFVLHSIVNSSTVKFIVFWNQKISK
ncbi:hypothetical protein [Brevibacillus choshinensis]|uniref:hypothetical protein n=1 Tax=Brevibacillus choshinensis TaxID=54911 RepID=UPI0013798DFE|nr:hypothetical protein [Brevibacillus choshinensis]